MPLVAVAAGGVLACGHDPAPAGGGGIPFVPPDTGDPASEPTWECTEDPDGRGLMNGSAGLQAACVAAADYAFLLIYVDPVAVSAAVEITCPTCSDRPEVHPVVLEPWEGGDGRIKGTLVLDYVPASSAISPGETTHLQDPESCWHEDLVAHGVTMLVRATLEDGSETCIAWGCDYGQLLETTCSDPSGPPAE